MNGASIHHCRADFRTTKVTIQGSKVRVWDGKVAFGINPEGVWRTKVATQNTKAHVPNTTVTVQHTKVSVRSTKVGF
jgi:hypothetical protein